MNIKNVTVLKIESTKLIIIDNLENILQCLKYSWILSFSAVSGSCVNAGYQACCNFDYSDNFCRGDDNVCMCDDTCSIFGDCCSDHSAICRSLSSSCVDANYTSCCTSGNCFGAAPSCKCDAACRTRGDCCDDIETTCCKCEDFLSLYIILLFWRPVCLSVCLSVYLDHSNLVVLVDKAASNCVRDMKRK